MTEDRLTAGHHYAAVDGLRAFAVAAVIGYHGSKSLAPGGFLGVDTFFVISGFVITLTLLREQERTNRISLSRFYWRRFWRLTPALVAAIIWTGIFTAAFKLDSARDFVAQAVEGLTYTYNLAQVIGDDRGTGILSHLWSLGVEEQFYLLWAPLLAFGLLRMPTRKHRVTALLALFVLFVALRIATYFAMGDLAAFFLPWARFDQFTVGGIVALVMHHSKTEAPGWVRAPVASVISLAALAAGVLLVQDLTDEWLFLGGYTVSALLAAIIVAHGYSQAPSVVNRLLGSSPLVWVGQRSYGIYLYHFAVSRAFQKFEVFSPLALILTAVISVVVAAASYRYIEQPLRKRGQRN